MLGIFFPNFNFLTSSSKQGGWVVVFPTSPLLMDYVLHNCSRCSRSGEDVGIGKHKAKWRGGDKCSHAHGLGLFGSTWSFLARPINIPHRHGPSIYNSEILGTLFEFVSHYVAFQTSNYYIFECPHNESRMMHNIMPYLIMMEFTKKQTNKQNKIKKLWTTCKFT